MFALPTDAAGTKGGFEGETASIVAAKITLERYLAPVQPARMVSEE